MSEKLWGSYAECNFKYCVVPSEGLHACLYVHHAASHEFCEIVLVGGERLEALSGV